MQPTELLQVDTPARSLDNDETDGWGNVFPQGSRVIVGTYFQNPTSTKSGYIFKLIKDRKALVFVASVCYIFPANKMTRRGVVLKLSEEDHLDILDSINECC